MAKQAVRHQRAREMINVQTESCPDTSSSSDSQTMPTLELSQDEPTVPRKESNASLLSQGSTLDAAQPATATHMEQTVHDIMTRHGARRNSTGSIPIVPDGKSSQSNATVHGKTAVMEGVTSVPKPGTTTTGLESTSGLPQTSGLIYAPPVNCSTIFPPGSSAVTNSDNAPSFVDQIAAVNELPRRALGLTTTQAENVPNALPAPTITPTRLLRNADPPSNSTDRLRNDLLPGLLRRNSVPSRHQVVPHQVDHEIVMHEHPSNQLLGDLVGFRKEKEEEKDETWNRLNELTTFALCGFGFFQTRIGTGRIIRSANPLLFAKQLRKRKEIGNWV